MRWTWRSSTEPPVLARLLLSLAVGAADRRFVLSDLQEELEARTEREGRVRARRWYRQQALRSLEPLLRHRLGPRAAPRSGSAPVGWRPEPSVARESRLGDVMTHLIRDLRGSLRSLRNNPAVFLVTVLSLTLGIGAATAVFTIANAILLRPSGGIGDPDGLVAVYTSGRDGDRWGDTSFPDFESLLAEVPALEKAAAFRIGMVSLDDGGDAQRLMVEIVSGGYFDVVGIHPVLGRAFSPDETRNGSAQRLVVLGHGLWQRRFGGDPGVIGRQIRLDGRSFTVIGVAPPGMTSTVVGLQIDAWVPLGTPNGIYNATPRRLADRGDRQYRVLGRLRAGTSAGQLGTELTLLAGRLHEEHRQDWENDRGEALAFSVLEGEDAALPPDGRVAAGTLVSLLFAVTGLILFIACSNVASLYLARAFERRREMAVRLALGASRVRLASVLLVESLVPALIAAGLGTALAIWATHRFQSIPVPIAAPLRFDLSPDLTVLLFAVLLAIATSLVFGLAPALEASRPDLVPSLKDGARGALGPSRQRLRRILVVGQVAAALVFVAGCGLAVRSLQEAASIDGGVDPQRIATMSKALSEDLDTEGLTRTYDGILGELSTLPGVVSAHLSRTAETTFLSELYRAEVLAEGSQVEPGSEDVVAYNSVTPGYFETLGIRLEQGRTLDSGDRAGAPRVAVVTRDLADRLWPGEEALGRRFRITGRRIAEGSDREAADPLDGYEVVGVAADAAYTLSGETVPFFWTSLLQDPARRVFILLEGRDDPAEMAALLRQKVTVGAGETLLIPATPYRDLVDFLLLGHRIASQLLGWSGLFGTALAVIGIYGVVAFAVTARRREIAIRQALGARPGQEVRRLAREGTGLALWGLGVGLVLVVTLASLARSDLFGLSPLDPPALIGSALLLGLAASVASVIPARRVTRVDPIATLRSE